jgi:hypothetical protein
MKVMKAKTTDQTTPLRDRCLSHFAALRIPIEAAALDELLTRAEKESFSHLSFLDRLLGAEAGARRERAVARRIREARFAENKTMEAFDWNFNPKTFDPGAVGRTRHRRLHPPQGQSGYGGLERPCDIISHLSNPLKTVNLDHRHFEFAGYERRA